VKIPRGAGTLAVIALASVAFFYPARGAWLFAAAEFAFLAWLARRMRKTDAAALIARAREPLEHDEADIVQRYPLYFAHPELARQSASMVAALGLASLVLVPWLTYKLQWAQAIVIGICLFPVGRLTRVLSPLLALRMAANKGDREALRLLGAHDGARRKL
jgi:hypothetical protein